MRFGERVFQIKEGSLLLQARGWTKLGEGPKRGYSRPRDFLRAPNDVEGSTHSIIQAEIPTQEQVLRVAKDVFSHKEWRGSMGEWPAMYLPRCSNT